MRTCDVCVCVCVCVCVWCVCVCIEGVHVCLMLFFLLLFRPPSEDEGMDIHFEEGVLSPSAADMRPGERNVCSFYSWPAPRRHYYSVRGPHPVHLLVMSVTKVKRGRKCVRERCQAWVG